MSSPLNVVVAPDSFKGSATAVDVAAAIGAGWSEGRPADTVHLLPMADGGEGTIDAFAVAVPGAIRTAVTVTGPDDRPVDAEWLWLPPGPGGTGAGGTGAGGTGAGGTGVVELANTSGITLLDPLRPLDAHTVGFGQAIAAALDYGVDRLVLALGGSSSTDGGAGALVALGARLLGADGEPVVSGARGLETLVTADLSGLRSLPPGGAVILTDVTNPLLGENGAAVVFGPQKGADHEMVGELDVALATFARVLGAGPGAPDVDTPGAGAAGGTGFGLTVWGAVIHAGADAVGRAIGLPGRIELADVVITGEGRFDNQSAAGKVPSYVLGLAHRYDTVALLVAGAVEADPESFAVSVSLSELAGSSEEAIANPKPLLHAAGRSLARGVEKTSTQSTT